MLNKAEKIYPNGVKLEQAIAAKLKQVDGYRAAIYWHIQRVPGSIFISKIKGCIIEADPLIIIAEVDIDHWCNRIRRQIKNLGHRWRVILN